MLWSILTSLSDISVSNKFKTTFTFLRTAIFKFTDFSTMHGDFPPSSKVINIPRCRAYVAQQHGIKPSARITLIYSGEKLSEIIFSSIAETAGEYFDGFTIAQFLAAIAPISGVRVKFTG